MSTQQSNYTFNADLSYYVIPWNASFTVSYNVSGERLDLVTTGAMPDVYEQPAPTLNFIISKAFRSGWAARLSMSNLLDPAQEKTLSHGGEVFIHEGYRTGRSFSLSVSREF